MRKCNPYVKPAKPKPFWLQLIPYALNFSLLQVSEPFGPRVLACPTRGGGRSEAGHRFHLLIYFFLLLQHAINAKHDRKMGKQQNSRQTSK